MLSAVQKEIAGRAASVWRSFGSPRIYGDEKAVRATRSTWSAFVRAATGFAGLGAKARNAIIASSGIAVSIVVIWLVFVGFGASADDGDSDEASAALATPTPEAGPVYLTEVIALSSAVDAARKNGLISDEFGHIARRIQFGEYAQAVGETYRADKGQLEASSETEVWAFGFAGEVELELDNGETVYYDNLTVVIDAITAQVYRVEAFYGEYESEARAPIWLRPPTPTAEPG